MAETLFQNIIEFIPKVRGAGFNQLNNGISKSYKGLFSLKNMFSAFFGYDLYSSIRNAIPAMIDTSRQLGAIHARLFAATGSAKGANEEFNWLLDTTKKLGIELMTTSDQYSMFAASAKQTFNMGQIREIFGGMMSLQRVLHIPADRMQRVLWGLTRMSSEATIKMRDFYALQQLPGSLPIAMRAAGFKNDQKGVEKFYEAVRKRQVYSAQFIPKFVEMLNKQYVTAGKLQEAMNQVDAQIQLLQRHAQGFQVALAKAGFQKDLISTLKILNKSLDFLETHAHGIYKGIKDLIKIIGILALSSLILKVAGVGVKVVELAKDVGILNAIILTTKDSVNALAISKGGKFLLDLLGAGAGLTGFWLSLAIGIVVFRKEIVALFDKITLKITLMNIQLEIMLLNLERKHPWLTKMFSGLDSNIRATKAEDKRNPDLRDRKMYISEGKAGGGGISPIPDSGSTFFNRHPFLKPAFWYDKPASVQVSNKFTPNNKIDIHVDGAQSPADTANAIEQKIAEYDQKQKEKFARDISGSKPFSYNPLSILNVF